MTDVKSVLAGVVRLGLIGGFAAIGVIALALLGIAVSLAGGLVWRLVLVVFGVLGLMIAVGAVRTLLRGPDASA